MIDEKLLRSEERAVYGLRALYRRYGYSQYKMSKFEEYELYMRNKDFLVSDRLITFNDTNGRLMALKPDVTLSIIRSGADAAGIKRKVCYNENVYRVSETTGRFKEIMQSGLECMGDIDLYDVYEVVSLAAQSLALVSDSFVLEISHLGVLSAVLERASTDAEFGRRAAALIAEKNPHDLRRLCSEYGVAEEHTEALVAIMNVYGRRDRVLEELSRYFGGELDELRTLSALLDTSPYSDRILFDFSVVNDMSYYNGFVFKGFLDGISEGVLAGGQYDKLMSRMGRRAGAIGFALYLDLLEQLERGGGDYDVNVLLLYDDSVDCRTVAERVGELVASGLTVSAQKAVPEKLRWRELIDIRGTKERC